MMTFMITWIQCTCSIQVQYHKDYVHKQGYLRVNTHYIQNSDWSKWRFSNLHQLTEVWLHILATPEPSRDLLWKRQVGEAYRHSNKRGFMLTKLRPNFMTDCRNWRASLTWTRKSWSVWKAKISVCMLTGICLHWWFYRPRVECWTWKQSLLTLWSLCPGQYLLQMASYAKRQICTCICFKQCRCNPNPISWHCLPATTWSYNVVRNAREYAKWPTWRSVWCLHMFLK